MLIFCAVNSQFFYYIGVYKTAVIRRYVGVDYFCKYDLTIEDIKSWARIIKDADEDKLKNIMIYEKVFLDDKNTEVVVA